MVYTGTLPALILVRILIATPEGLCGFFERVDPLHAAPRAARGVAHVDSQPRRIKQPGEHVERHVVLLLHVSEVDLRNPGLGVVAQVA